MVDSSSNQELPKIVFPCAYPIRIMGAATPDFKDYVVSVLKKHAPDFKGEVNLKASRTGKYLSVHVVIMATGVEQLKALNEDLKASGRVQMVL
ncbi:MAG: DUF493 domain-containing protein [Candidatus Endonucleobacter bathymodioli]|uniref:UPF0250 protein QS748_05325 n=1 Tax=Candidatus Endonucleibacter bathymodioli TaxID=539814 RepID=A0AA90NL64_9GAMM|nr:DUF493 domain-containing protein [Candidatus Endonucleobacter bathymodioli]